NKKQFNLLSASLSKALSPPSRRKIELSAQIIDQVQPLPGIGSRPAYREPKHRSAPRQLGKLAPNQEVLPETHPPPRLSTSSHLVPSLGWSPSTDRPPKTFLRQRIVRIQRIQDGLTMAEQRVLNYLWENGERESSPTSRGLTVTQKALSFATH